METHDLPSVLREIPDVADMTSLPSVARGRSTCGFALIVSHGLLLDVLDISSAPFGPKCSDWTTCVYPRWRYSLGVTPVDSLKATENLEGLSYPTRAPISATLRSVSLSSFAASSIRTVRTYAAGEEP